MRKLVYIVLMVVLAGAVQEVRSQTVQAFARIDTNAIMIGDQIGLELGIELPEGYQVGWPELTDTLSKNIEIVSAGKIDSLLNGGNLTLQQRLSITSFDSGEFQIPPIRFLFRAEGDTAISAATTNPLLLRVYTPEVDTTQPFKVIKGPVAEPLTFKEILPWMLLAFVLAVLIGLGIWYWQRRKNKKGLFAPKPKPVLPPHVEAINRLEELRLAKIWQQGRIKLYHSKLTDIIREYMERRFGFNAPEMTTDEILDSLRKIKVNNEVLEKLSASLRLADLVKFAKAQPTALENDLSLDHCIDFVNETKAADEEKKETENVEQQNGEQQ